jgi:peptidoglycan/xylan/chitin deacetylase (PgdA/CDA1 family)
MTATTVPILMYHGVSEEIPRRYRRFILPPAAFAEQLAYLDLHGFTPLRVGEFAAILHAGGTGLPERPVVLTFDDGLADFYSGALPGLVRHGFGATLYIVTGYVGGRSTWERRLEGRRPMLTWEQVRQIDAGGVECGAHTHTHPELDVVSPARARAEILQSKRVLERELEREITTFAYPYGWFNAATRALVREAGYSSACACNNALSSTIDDPYALVRVTVTADTDLDAFARIVHGTGLRTAPCGERLRTRLFRVARRCRALARPQAPIEGLA